MDRKGSGIIFNQREDSYEERKSRLEDEGSVSSAEDTLISKSLRHTYFFFQNIRFTPKVMEFINAFEGKQFTEKLIIQNVGKNPVHIKIGEPNSFIFQLKKPTTRAKFLPAGASICKTITYTYHNDDLVQRSQVPIQVNGILVDYPIIVKKAKPEIEVQPQKLHFEVINLGASAKSMTLTIYNIGGKRTKFEIDCGNSLDLVVTPMRGTVKPKQSVEVRVEIMGFVEGEYYRELWIKTTEVPIRVPVLVEVVRPRLEIVYPAGTQNFTLIDFQPAFIGTQRIGSLMLRNISTENTQFVALAELDDTLQVIKNAKKLSDSFNMFDFLTEEGNLAPFETRVFSVLFCPKDKILKKGWRHKESERKSGSRCDHVVFFTIHTVFHIERKELANVENQTFPPPGFDKTYMLTKPSSAAENSEDQQSVSPMKNTPEEPTQLFSNTAEEKSVRFCLHGQIVDPNILIQPSSFEFGVLSLGQTEKKVLRITNNSILPVKCKLCKTMNVTTEPKVVWLNSQKAQEFLISLTPKCAGTFKSKLKVEILAESDDFDSGKAILVTVFVYNVILSYTAQDVPAVLVPKIGFGITPLFIDEVGLHKDLITFKDASKFPYAAMLGLKKGFKPAWMRTDEDQVNNVDNAIVALPNDRPRFFQSWPKDKICRSIFKGFFRYSPPEDLTYTLSQEGRIERKERRQVWTEYIWKRLEQNRHPILGELKGLEREVPCKLSLIGREKTVSSTEVAKRIQNYFKKPDTPNKYTMVPLSPMFLFHIVVEPKLINFNMVAVATKTQELVTIKNMNSFAVSVKFIAGNSNVSVLENAHIISPYSSISIQVFLLTKDFGRYFGFLNYVINEAHEFKITISAFVISKTLFLNKTNLCLDFVKNGAKGTKDIFMTNSVFLPLQNLLQTPVKYKLNLSEDSTFVTDITEGVIPPRTTLLAEVCLKLNPRKSFHSELALVSESGHTELIKLAYTNRKVAVSFLNGQMNMKDVPLNLPTRVKPKILNCCYHDVTFEVLTLRPMPGVTVVPKEGVIRARSFYELDIIIQIPVMMQFSFDVHLSVHFCHRISMTVTGNVVFPIIRMKPSEVTLKKICEESFDTFTLSVINEGTTRAEIKLDFSTCPEFSVINGPSELNLSPNQPEKITIRFEPRNATRYVFYLPLIINSILGPVMIQESDTEFAYYYISELESEYDGYGNVINSENSKLRLPCFCINCLVSRALLLITPLNVDFQAAKNSQFQPQNIVISNVSYDNVTFCISGADIGEGTDSPFDLVPVKEGSVEYKVKTMRVHLPPGEKLVLLATYRPKTCGKHKVEIPIFVKGYNNGLVYNYIRLSGTSKEPRIYPPSSEVYFSALPLGIASEVVLMIYAENYVAPDQIYCVVWDSLDGNDNMENKLSAKWLTEPNVSGTLDIQAFQLQITFQSFVPVALRTYMILIDTMGRYATILVSALADNSTLTIHSFLSAKSSKFKLKNLNALSKCKAGDATSPVYQSKSEVKYQRNVDKAANRISKTTVEISEPSVAPESSAGMHEPIELGPMLVVQMTKSMTRISQLGFVKVIKNLLNCKDMNKHSVNYDMTSNELKVSFHSQSESLSTSKAVPSNDVVNKNLQDEIPYPDFPTRENAHWNYYINTTALVERWMYEVVMRCDQYLTIPQSFQQVKVEPTVDKEKKVAALVEKDFLSFLEEIIGSDRNLPKRPVFNEKGGHERACIIQSFFLDILIFLKSKGCLLPHIRPEYLMDYEDYEAYVKSVENFETFTWENLELKGVNSRIIEEPSVHIQQTLKTKPESVVKENSSVFFPKDFWVKSLSESLNMMDNIPENMDDENTELTQTVENSGSTWNVVHKKMFQHTVFVLDKVTFESRSTQAWLDIVIQIFRVFILSKIIRKNTISQVRVSEMSDKKVTEICFVNSMRNYLKKPKGIMGIPTVDSLSSNIFSVQERILLGWLNHHLSVQEDIFVDSKTCCKHRPLNNFDKDLSDSVALIAVTASHCPFIVPDYFTDVFSKPDTPNKVTHNAGRLVQAWRTLELGLTVETRDIIKPNPVFMIMLLAHLYEVLPLLYPRSAISFSGSLNSEVSRTIQLRNDSQQRLVFEAKLFGEHERFFELGTTSAIEIKPLKSVNVTVLFSVIKIKKISATLFLNGCSSSPDFAKHIAFHLEGEPSDISEYEKMSFCAPLYKVICTEIPIKPPFPDPTTYEVWYTTKKPMYLGDSKCPFKPWSEIWKAKVARRLFLNKNDITIDEEGAGTILSITVACLTNKKRLFWLLFRSEIGDFIVQIEINTKPPDGISHVDCVYSDLWSPSASCTCLQSPPRMLCYGTCPLLATLKIPARNGPLWNALRKMFLKTLHPQEVSFWDEHFEMDIGICLILWLLSPDEEEEVLDEFIDVLTTKVTFTLTLEPSDAQGINMPPTIEIPDVRSRTEICLPIHLSKESSSKKDFRVTMVAESQKEVRHFKARLQVPKTKLSW